jgi:superfamily II DNA or RNA helicase
METVSVEIMNNLYSSLLDTYINKSHEEYLKEKKIIENQIKGKKYDFQYKNGFIPYPDYEDVEFNKKIYNKKEFNRNKAILDISDYDKVSNDQCSFNSFSLTSNQKFIKGFLSPLTPYNGLLLFHSVGTGKSCSAISIAEQYHEIYKKKVLIILSSNLEDNFRKQIFDITKYDIKKNIANICTGTKYPDMILDKQKLNDEELDKKIKHIINEKYEFLGYKELAIKIEKIENKFLDSKKFNEKISEIFSDRLIIVDEAHNLRNPNEKNKKQTSKAFKDLLINVINVKLVLLTATPMFNNSKEIIWTLNLLLINDKRPELTESMVFDKLGDLTENGRKILIDRSRGYISYMRGETPFAFPFRLYPKINNDKNLLKYYPEKDIYGNTIDNKNKIKHLEIIVSNMSDYQKDIYMKNKSKGKQIKEEEEEEEEDEEIENTEVNNDLQNIMQISNVVYPNPNNKDIKSFYGNKGFDLNFITDKNGKFEYKNNNNQFLSYNSINDYAPKIKSVIDYVIKSKGIVFIYSRYYASGIIPLAIALEHIGFVKYTGSNLIKKINVVNKFPQASAEGKNPKYIILSKKIGLSPNNDHEISLSKNIDNLRGEKIKVIIVSKIGTEGIDFKRIREIHLLDPWFNLNRAEQIIGRGVRFCSHIDLPKAERNVTIMFHAAKYDDKEESVDLRTYRIAEIKQKRITEIEKLLKENSIDCNLNKETQVYPVEKLNIKFDIETSQGTKIKSFKIGDVDNSQICNYEKCKAKCYPDITEKNKIDESSFDIKFIKDDIDIYKRYISLLFKNSKISFSYEQILKLLKKEYNIINEEILYYTLDDLVIKKDILFDFKNQSGYLIYRSNLYIFQKTRFSDTRLTIEERKKDINNRKNLSLSELYSKIKPIKSNVFKNTTKNNNSNNNSNNNLNNNLNSKKTIESINNINKQYNNIFEIIYLLVIDTFISTFNKTEMSELLSINNIYIKKYIKKIEEADKIEEIAKAVADKTKEIKKTEKIEKVIKVIHDVMNKLDEYIIDYVIDRLTNIELLILIQEIANKSNEKLTELEKKYLHSLISGSIVFLNDKHIKYYYNYFDENLYRLESGNFQICIPIEMNNLKDINTIIDKNKVGLKDKTKGYISTTNKNNTLKIDFKIRDIKGSGSVCHQTSTFTSKKLIEMIKNINADMISPNNKINISKNNLCIFYEIILRSYRGDEFQRPHYLK